MSVGRTLRLLMSTAGAFLLALAPFQATAQAPATRPAFQVGLLQDRRVPELSGLSASRRDPALFWAHNDSGSPAELFAVRRTGEVVARVPVQGARNVDWEDLAADADGRLYVADTGNNNRSRREVFVYRFDEPVLKAADAKPIRPAARWTLRYPAEPFDCEALVVHGGFGYLIPKLRNFQEPILHRFPLKESDRPVTLEAVGAVRGVRTPVTAASLSPDAREMAVLTVLGPFVFRVDGDVTGITRTPPAGQFAFAAIRMEAAVFTSDGLLAGTEEGNLYLFNWAMLGIKPPLATTGPVKAP